MPSENRVVAAENPELANAMIEQILNSTQQPLEPVTATQLPDTYVDLPGGLLTETGLVRDAQVKELTGFDEEELSKATGSARYFQTLLLRGVAKIGDETPNAAMLNRLLAGDRDTLALAIRRVTYGSDIELVEIECPNCHKLVSLKVDLDKDVEIKRLETAADRQFTVPLRKGEAVVHLPTGEAQQAVLAADGKTNAELTTLVLRYCVEEVNGVPVLGEDSVRRLTVKDRQALVDALNNHGVGPQLSAVKKACPSCEGDINLPLSLQGLFQF